MGTPTKADVRRTYETIAESFAKTRREPWPEVLTFINSLSARSPVLDLGCGNGRHAATLAAKGHPTIGVDFSRRLLGLGRAQAAHQGWADRAEWIEAEVGSLPFHNGSFAACICVAVLHHLPTPADRIAALSEVRRVLSTPGRALFSVWALDQPRFRDVVEQRRPLNPPTWGDVHVPWMLPNGSVLERYYHLFQEDELEPLIIESGLQVETFFRSAGNYFCLARKDG